MRSLKAIFFDNDGILVDTEGIFFEATREALAMHGLKLSTATHAELSLRRGVGIKELAVAAGLPDSAPADGLRADRNRIFSAMLEKASENDSLPIPGAMEAVSTLSQHFTLGIVTSCLSEHFKIIHRRSGLLPFFSFIVGEGDYSRWKPEPEPYLAALSSAGVLACEALSVEDSERGLASSVAAGIPCAAIPRGLSSSGDFSKAWKTFASIEEFASFIMDSYGNGLNSSHK